MSQQNDECSVGFPHVIFQIVFHAGSCQTPLIHHQQRDTTVDALVTCSELHWINSLEACWPPVELAIHVCLSQPVNYNSSKIINNLGYLCLYTRRHGENRKRRLTTKAVKQSNLADRTNGHVYATVLRLSSVYLSSSVVCDDMYCG